VSSKNFQLSLVVEKKMVVVVDLVTCSE